MNIVKHLIQCVVHWNIHTRTHVHTHQNTLLCVVLMEMYRKVALCNAKLPVASELLEVAVAIMVSCLHGIL